MLFRYESCSSVRPSPTRSIGLPVADAEILSANPYPEHITSSSLSTFASFKIARLVAKRSFPASLLTLKLFLILSLTSSGIAFVPPSK